MTDEELEAAKRWITPEIQAQYTLKDGTVDYKVGNPERVVPDWRDPRGTDFQV